MAANKVSLRYLVLGLLAQQSMSGYDIQRILKSLGWLIGKPSTGSLYPILRALPEEGLATVEVEPSVDKPPKKTYTITEAGRQELKRCTDQPASPEAPLKAFVMSLLLAGSLTPGRLLHHLEQRQAQVTAHHTALQQTVESLQNGDELGQYLAMDYGLALSTAELNWLNRMIGMLSAAPPGRADKEGSNSSPVLNEEGARG
jgi:DNA-binding PadR family transcriptional regulator